MYLYTISKLAKESTSYAMQLFLKSPKISIQLLNTMQGKSQLKLINLLSYTI